MDLQRAIETQRIALLRLLTGWIAVVEILSCAALADRSPRWLLVFFASMLSRAEKAAAYLVFASARVLAEQGGSGLLTALRPAVGVVLYAAPAIEREEEFSTDALLARMRVLKEALANLPRHAARLVRRCVESDAVAGGDTRSGAVSAHGGGGVLRSCQRRVQGTTYLPIV